MQSLSINTHTYAKLRVKLCMFLLCVIAVTQILPLANISYANNFLNDESAPVAGRPRFSEKEKKGKLYFGIGVVMNTYDHVGNTNALGISDYDSINTAYNAQYGTTGGSTLEYQPTGYSQIVVGYQPASIQWMRHELELTLRFVNDISGDVNSSNPFKYTPSGSGTTTSSYDTLYLNTQQIRLMYNLLLMVDIPQTTLSAFIGPSFGITSNYNTIMGEASSTSSSSGSTTTTDTGSSSVTTLSSSDHLFSIVAGVMGGISISITKGFGAEIRGKYVWTEVPFGYNGAAAGQYGANMGQVFELAFLILMAT